MQGFSEKSVKMELSHPNLFSLCSQMEDQTTDLHIGVFSCHTLHVCSTGFGLVSNNENSPKSVLQSYNNPAERCMSLLNIALQNTALQREKMEDQFEF